MIYKSSFVLILLSKNIYYFNLKPSFVSSFENLFLDLSFNENNTTSLIDTTFLDISYLIPRI